MREKDIKTRYHHGLSPDHFKPVKVTKPSLQNEGIKKSSRNKEVEKQLIETNSNSKFKSIKKTINKTLNIKSDPEPDHTTNHGSLKQYCVKGSEVLLRDVHYLKNEKSKMLMITVDDKQHQTDTYTILSTKDVCPFTFKDRNAFVLKVLDINKKLKSMTFQAVTEDEKKMWLSRYSLNMSVACELLNICIKEVERRRFQLGLKKRSEEKSKVKVEADSLADLMTSLSKKQETELHSTSQWTVGNLERLIQLLLNELLQPLVSFNCQRVLRRSPSENINSESEAKEIINNLPNINRTMLTLLLSHMERLSNYYLIVMSSPKKILPQIRRNICRRLSPIIFRIQHDLEKEDLSLRCSEILYNMMLFINNTIDGYE